MKKRAAIVCRIINPLSGAGIMILEHARRLSQTGWEVDILCRQADRFALKEAGATMKKIQAWPWGSFLKRLSFARMADRAVHDYSIVHGHGDHFRQDVLNIHNSVHAANEAIYGQPLSPKSAVGRIHERIFKEGKFKFLIANSQMMRKDMISRWKLDPEKIRVIYCGIRLEKFPLEDRMRKRAPQRQELGFSEQDIVFGLVASGDFKKRGVDLFIRALGKLSSNKKIKAIIVGKENHIGIYQDMANAVGMKERLRFLKPITNVENYYHAIDVFVYPARYEEFGIGVLEAMACGLPIICADSVGAAELFGKKTRKFLFSHPCDIEELAGKMTSLAEDESLRRALGEGAGGIGKTRGWDQNFSEISALYESILPSR